MAWRVEFFHEPSAAWIPLSMRVRTQAEADWVVATLTRTQGLSCRVRVLEQELELEPDPEPAPIARPVIKPPVVTTTLTSVVRHAPHPDPPPEAPKPSQWQTAQWHISGERIDPRRCLKVLANGRGRCGQWRGEHPSLCAFHRRPPPEPPPLPPARPIRPVPRQWLDDADCWRQSASWSAGEGRNARVSAPAVTYGVGTEDTFYEEETALYRDTAALNWPHGRIRTRVRRTNEEMPGRAVGRWRNFRHE